MRPPGGRTQRDSAPTPENRHSRGEGRRAGKGLVRIGGQEHATHEPLISSLIVAEVPLTGLSLRAERQLLYTALLHKREVACRERDYVLRCFCSPTASLSLSDSESFYLFFKWSFR
jgi:hypothetical protein